MKITVREVARHAGVSSGTVSRVLNNQDGVNAQLRRRVLDSVAELGYTHRGSRTRTPSLKEVGFLLALRDVEEDRPRMGQFWAEILFSVESRARSEGIRVIFRPLLGLLENPDSAAEQVADMGLTAAFIVGPAPEASVRALAKSGILPILIDNSFPGWEGNAVLSDDFGGTYKAVQYLAELGHREIGFIGGPSAAGHPAGNLIYSIAWRELGYREGLEAFGISPRPELVEHCQLTALTGREAAARMLDTGLPVTALVAANDPTAVGILEELSARGIAVPGEISVIGFDDHPMPDPGIPLTTLAVNTEAIGQVAVRLLKDALLQQPYLAVTASVPVTLRVRETTAPPPALKRSIKH